MEHIKEKPVQPGQIPNITPSPPSDGFPHSSVGKESACNAGDPGSIPGSGRSPGEGIGYLLQYSWASLVAQLIKNLPATQKAWVRSLGWEDSLEKGKATHSSILAWRIPWTLQSMRSELDTTEQLSLHFSIKNEYNISHRSPTSPKQTHPTQTQSLKTFSNGIILSDMETQSPRPYAFQKLLTCLFLYEASASFDSYHHQSRT